MIMGRDYTLLSSPIVAAEIEYLLRTAGKTRRACIRNERIREELKMCYIMETIGKK